MSNKLRISWLALQIGTLFALGCGSSPPATNTVNSSAAGASVSSGNAGANNAGGASSGAGTSGSTGIAGTSNLGSAGATTTAAGAGGAGGSTVGGAGAAGTSSAGGASIPADYKGTPFTTLTIPGTIHASDYDRGGAGVAYCHANPNNCQDGVKTDDWRPANTPVYRMPTVAGAMICGGAACNDNAGLCHMNTGEPDNTTAGLSVTPEDVYPCYVATGEWLKFTVQVMAAGTYSVGGFMAVPAGVSITLDFGAGLSTGPFMLPLSPTDMCRCPETYHSWETAQNLAMVTFPAAGTYVLTMTVVSQQFNPDTFVFTKM
jgi:hypothetical protein